MSFYNQLKNMTEPKKSKSRVSKIPQVKEPKVIKTQTISQAGKASIESAINFNKGEQMQLSSILGGSGTRATANLNIDLDEVKQFLNISYEDEATDEEVERIIKSATKYVKNYTGRTEESIAENEDLIEAIFLVCSEMYDNRGLNNVQYKRNLMLQSILDMHSINLL